MTISIQFLVLLGSLLLAQQSLAEGISSHPMTTRFEDNGLIVTGQLFEVLSDDGHVDNLFYVNLVHLTPAMFTLNLQYSREGTSLAIEGAELLSKNVDRYVVLSGGFLKSYDPVLPTGFLRMGGKMIVPGTPPANDPIMTGVFCIEGGSPRFYAAAEFAFSTEETQYDECLQAGPLLINKGERILQNPLEPSTIVKVASQTYRQFVLKEYERAFLGSESSGQIVLGYSSRVSLTDLTAALVGNFELVEAINLQGAGNAGLLVSSGANHHFSIGQLGVDQSTVLIARPR